MDTVHFYKYSAAGNDFIVLDNRDQLIELTPNTIRSWCDRHFGIGADGILLLQPEPGYDYRMVYYNADGTRGEMCGNGARALNVFARKLKVAGEAGKFLADDGPHGYRADKKGIWIEILVNPTRRDLTIDNKSMALLNTGVPHLIYPVDAVANTAVHEIGTRLSPISETFPDGANINFLENADGVRRVRTYERGVNAETLACGTGATACAIYLSGDKTTTWPISLEFPGGVLTVDWADNGYWLTGPVELAFEGNLPTNRLWTQTNRQRG